MDNPIKDWFCARTNETHAVDAGLEDDWLETLNSFQHLYLRSICEGHLNGTRLTATKSMPILRLSVESRLYPAMLAAHPPTEREIEALFNASPLCAASDAWLGWADTGSQEYCLHLDAKRERASDQMEESVRDWFRESIIFLTHVDALLAGVTNDSSSVAS